MGTEMERISTLMLAALLVTVGCTSTPTPTGGWPAVDLVTNTSGVPHPSRVLRRGVPQTSTSGSSIPPRRFVLPTLARSLSRGTLPQKLSPIFFHSLPHKKTTIL